MLLYLHSTVALHAKSPQSTAEWQVDKTVNKREIRVSRCLQMLVCL